jgi:transcription antitermination factor NusG
MEETKTNIQSSITNKLTYHWHALYTRSRHEKRVYDELIYDEIEAYLPLHTVIKQWSDRKKKVEEPMIRSYVFVKISEKEYYDVLNIPAAVRYVTFEGKAASIPEWQIDVMKKALEYNLPHYYSNEIYAKGEKIKITDGPLCGREGEVVHDTNGKQKVIIRIANIGYSMVVESPVSIVKKVKSLKD